MATKNFAYDHPAYQVPYVFSGSTTVGAHGVSTKFAAFTTMKIKGTVMAPNIASTSASQPLLYTKSGTTTATTTLTALTSAATTAIVNDVTDVSLAQGDQFWITHGTDATVSLSVAVQAEVVPGSSISD
jgi:hypothetical protein